MSRYGLIRLPLKSSPSFNQVYLSGGVPFAIHVSKIEWYAGQALSVLLKVFRSVKTGFPNKKGRMSIKATRVYTLHSSLVILWVCSCRASAIRGGSLGLWQIESYLGWNWRDTTHFDSKDDYRTGRNVSHSQQQQSYSGLRSPGRSKRVPMGLTANWYLAKRTVVNW